MWQSSGLGEVTRLWEVNLCFPLWQAERGSCRVRLFGVTGALSQQIPVLVLDLLLSLPRMSNSHDLTQNMTSKATYSLLLKTPPKPQCFLFAYNLQSTFRFIFTPGNYLWMQDNQLWNPPNNPCAEFHTFLVTNPQHTPNLSSTRKLLWRFLVVKLNMLKTLPELWPSGRIQSLFSPENTSYI